MECIDPSIRSLHRRLDDAELLVHFESATAWAKEVGAVESDLVNDGNLVSEDIEVRLATSIVPLSKANFLALEGCLQSKVLLY